MDLYSEEAGQGVPILLIHPAGATASTWGPAIDQLARIGRVIAYDRRGYARSAQLRGAWYCSPGKTLTPREWRRPWR